MTDTTNGPPKQLSPRAFALMINTSLKGRRTEVRAIRSGGKVMKVPCPDGSIRLIGIAPNGRWVAEWSCCAEDWRDSMIDRMAMHVRHSRAVGVPRVRIV